LVHAETVLATKGLAVPVEVPYTFSNWEPKHIHNPCYRNFSRIFPCLSFCSECIKV